MCIQIYFNLCRSKNIDNPLPTGRYSIDNACHCILSSPACIGKTGCFWICVFFIREIQLGTRPAQLRDARHRQQPPAAAGRAVPLLALLLSLRCVSVVLRLLAARPPPPMGRTCRHGPWSVVYAVVAYGGLVCGYAEGECASCVCAAQRLCGCSCVPRAVHGSRVG
eukprot:SAG25_NODE_742_length_5598_cov_36.107110_1_plen_166_part_00